MGSESPSPSWEELWAAATAYASAHPWVVGILGMCVAAVAISSHWSGALKSQLRRMTHLEIKAGPQGFSYSADFAPPGPIDVDLLAAAIVGKLNHLQSPVVYEVTWEASRRLRALAMQSNLVGSERDRLWAAIEGLENARVPEDAVPHARTVAELLPASANSLDGG